MTPLGLRVLQIGSDRSPRGVLYPSSAGVKRQEAYAEAFGHLDIIGFSRATDGAKPFVSGPLAVHPTSSASRLLYAIDAIRIARYLPRPEVVSAQDPFEGGLVAWRIARRLHVPLHVQVHTDFLSPAYRRHSLINRARVFIARFVLKRAKRIRVVSERVKRSIETELRVTAPISVLPIFVDVESIRNHPVEDITQAHEPGMETFGRVTLLVVSRLEPEKNVELAIRALAMQRGQDIELKICGEGSQEQALKELASRLGIRNRVHFLGKRYSPGFYKAADAVLVTSWYEGYGMVIVEALAAGKPVLATDVGVAREAGAIVTSAEAFAKTLATWLQDGPRSGTLLLPTYPTFDAYVEAYCADIAQLAHMTKR